MKSHQEKDYTCGPAVLRSMIFISRGLDYSEAVLSDLANTNETYGTFPYDLFRAAHHLDNEIFMIENCPKAIFDQFSMNRCMCLLISTGPSYGHWVLCIPSHNGVVIDDPWDSEYWYISWEQLDDCWRWTFPNNMSFVRTAIISRPIGQIQIPSEKIYQWELPFLEDFPTDFVWTEESVKLLKHER